MSKKKKNKKIKDCGHGNHYWINYWCKKDNELKIKCTFCKKPGTLNLEMN